MTALAAVPRDHAVAAPSFELRARTPRGRELVALADELAVELSANAAAHDADGSYPFEAIDALRRARWFVAAAPAELGGLGVESVHDLVVASSRLARGDASVAIGANMHLVVVVNVARRWRTAVEAGQERRAEAFGELLRVVVEDGAILAAAVSEPGQNLTRPATTAVRTEEGWIVDGRKLFCTMSPAATALYTAVRFADGDGRERYGYALVPTDAPGVTINGDWDALGMRASGSHSVSFAGVALAASALRGGFRTGDATAYMERNLIAGLMHASASLGIAEAAHVEALAQLRAGRGSAGSSHTRMLVAASTIDLAALRATLGRAASLVEHGEPAADEVAAVFAEVQAAKAFANESATRIVDRALALSGGSGYLSASPLSRAYRDVRAGAFMHPLGANRAYDFIGGVALGLAPELD